MSQRSKLYKGGGLLAAGQVATQGLSLFRNIIIARALIPEDMGIAATFAITITLLEMISSMAVDLFLVQSKDGDHPQVQGVAQLFQVVRGFLIGIMLYALAGIVADVFHAPQAKWAYQMVAIVPVVMGFMHLDWKRQQRHLKYMPATLVEFFPQLLATLAAYPMVMWLHDFSAVLWLLLIQALTSLIMSHLVAERRYQLSFSKEYLRRIFVFGWPLMINGILILIAMQGDRFIVGAAYSMADLGVFSVVISMVLAVVLIVAKFTSSLLFPALSNVQNQQEKFRQCYLIGVYLLALFAGFSALPFIVVGGDMVVFVFGEQYVAAYAFVAWFGIYIAARLFRLAPTAAALGKGDTINLMIANIYRLLGVAGAIVVAWYMLPLAWVVACGALGEFLAFMVAVKRINKQFSIAFSDSLNAPVIVSTLLLSITVANHFVETGAGHIGVLLFSLVLLPVVMFLTLPLFGKFVRQELKTLKCGLVK